MKHTRRTLRHRVRDEMRFTKITLSVTHVAVVPHAEGTAYRSAHVHIKRHHINFEEGKERHRDKIESFIQRVHPTSSSHNQRSSSFLTS